MNLNDTAQNIGLPHGFEDLLSKRTISASVAIPPRNLLILSGV
jgi:hypothetical protein